MSMTDPIADLLTRIRNASRAGHASVEIPSSRVKSQIVGILKAQGFVKGYDILEKGGHSQIRVELRPENGRRRILNGLRRVSKPGRRVYVGHEDIPRVLNGLGVAILSTSKGIVTDEEARQLGVGGEVICEIW